MTVLEKNVMRAVLLRLMKAVRFVRRWVAAKHAYVTSTPVDQAVPSLQPVGPGRGWSFPPTSDAYVVVLVLFFDLPAFQPPNNIEPPSLASTSLPIVQSAPSVSPVQQQSMRPANLEGKMLFPEEDSPALKDWIVKRLENTLVAPTTTTLLLIVHG